jgi:hypothetical protein
MSGGCPVKTCSEDFQPNAALASWFMKRQRYNITGSHVLVLQKKVHNLIGGGLGGRILVFNKILVLIIRFSVPGTDEKSMKDLLNLLTHFCFRAVADQLAHCSPFSAAIF